MVAIFPADLSKIHRLLRSGAGELGIVRDGLTVALATARWPASPEGGHEAP